MVGVAPPDHPFGMTYHTNPLTIVLAAAVLLASTPLGASEIDDKITSAFAKTYVYKVYLRDDAVRASAKDGVVTLTGSVAEASHKALAQETAASLPGVIRVDNQIVSTAEGETGGSDGWIASKVRIALLMHRNVNATGTVIEVKEGTVTLKGTASSLAQKELTSEYAKDIDGVKAVQNDMTVLVPAPQAERTQAEKVDDASIAGQVRTALKTHRSTFPMQIGVEARNGEVTLTGIARNEAEKSLAGKLVTDIQGVVEVRNLITVDVPKTR